MATELFPIISTTDLDRALRFYRDLLGGEVTYEFAPPGGAIVYAAVRIGASSLGIGLDQDDDHSHVHGRISLWIYVDDCDAMVERMGADGAEIMERPVDQPWGERVARVRDPDGNQLYVGARRPEASA